MSVLNWIEFKLTTHPQTTPDRLGPLQDQINCFRSTQTYHDQTYPSNY